MELTQFFPYRRRLSRIEPLSSSKDRFGRSYRGDTRPNTDKAALRRGCSNDRKATSLRGLVRSASDLRSQQTTGRDRIYSFRARIGISSILISGLLAHRHLQTGLVQREVDHAGAVVARYIRLGSECFSQPFRVFGGLRDKKRESAPSGA